MINEKDEAKIYVFDLSFAQEMCRRGHQIKYVKIDPRNKDYVTGANRLVFIYDKNICALADYNDIIDRLRRKESINLFNAKEG